MKHKTRLRWLGAVAAYLFVAGCATALREDAGAVTLPAELPGACALSVIPDEAANMRLPFQIVHGRVYVEAQVNGTGRISLPLIQAPADWAAPMPASPPRLALRLRAACRTAMA